MSNLTIATVNFNTPEYIFALSHSFKKYNAWYTDAIQVYDNSTTKAFPKGTIYSSDITPLSIKYVDDSIYQPINELPPSKYPAAGNYNSARHAITIDYLMSFVTTPYLLLLDSDIVFTMNFISVFDYFVKSNAVMQGFLRDTYKHKCIAPWACFFNMALIQEYGLKYYDESRILYINDNTDYDTGASFYEDSRKLNLRINYTKDNTFYRHFKGGSVFKDNGIAWLDNNVSLWW